jgi:hypothetical protein
MQFAPIRDEARMRTGQQEPERVVVTVWHQGEAEARDLELPAEIPAAELAALVARALQWDGAFRIEVYPTGRVLTPYDTLAAAGVWDGAWLLFHPAQPQAAPAAPVVGWRPLE